MAAFSCSAPRCLKTFPLEEKLIGLFRCQDISWPVVVLHPLDVANRIPVDQLLHFGIVQDDPHGVEDVILRLVGDG